jgi:hypothetical protein
MRAADTHGRGRGEAARDEQPTARTIGVVIETVSSGEGLAHDLDRHKPYSLNEVAALEQGV